MSTRAIIVLALLSAPYVYLTYYWIQCFSTRCLLETDMLSFTFFALLALPFLLVGSGAVLAIKGTRKLSDGVKGGNAGNVASGGIGASLGFKLLAAGIPGVLVLSYFALDTPEPGRDRLGRICEKTNSGEICRPDPEADHPSVLDQANAARRRGH